MKKLLEVLVLLLIAILWLPLMLVVLNTINMVAMILIFGGVTTKTLPWQDMIFFTFNLYFMIKSLSCLTWIVDEVKTLFGEKVGD